MDSENGRISRPVDKWKESSDMNARKIRDGVWGLGAVDWNRRLFDSLIPLPDGTSYNAYLVEGTNKTVLLDTVDPSKADILMHQLDKTPQIDYVVSHHAEQDHSGTIPKILEKYPEARVLASDKAKSMLVDLLRISEDRILTVTDGEKISLGGKTLEFIYTPWVHWPETMSTYLHEDKILFSCDFFGSHYAATELFTDQDPAVYEAAKRYYAEIMMPFRNVIHKNMEKIHGHEIAMIAPSHGPVYRDAEFILEAYRDWIGEDVRNEVVLPYISMHGSTEKMVEILVSELAERKIKVYPFDLTVADLGKLAIALVDAATLVVGTPTVQAGPHPTVLYAAQLVNALRPKLRYASVIASYGWSSNAVEQITGLLPHLKVEILEPVVCRGYPRAIDCSALKRLAGNIAAKHMGIEQ